MKDLSVSIVGPFPEPIHGMSKSNEILFNYLSDCNYINVSCFDITLDRNLKSKDVQGKFGIYGFILSLVNLVKLVYFILTKRSDVFYITPPQSVLGYIRILPAIILAKLIGSKVVIHIHGSRFNYYIEHSRPIISKLIKSSFKFVDAFILLGRSIELSHKTLLENNKVFICENGVEDPKFEVNTGGRGTVNILFLSNLMKDKGFFDFLDAIENIKPSERYHFDIAGALEPSFSRKIKQRLQELGSNVSYHGLVTGKDKERLFNKANIFVLPSYDEGQPLSILEAYSYGCTVVTTNVGGIPDIFSDGINGKYVNVNDPVSIANVITGLNSSDLEFFSKTNMSIFRDRYTQKMFSNRIVEIIMKV